MAKRKYVTLALLVCFCLCLLPCTARAASTTEGKEPIDTAEACTLTIGYRYNETAFPGQTVKLYHIAEVSADFQYTLTDPFAPTGLVLNGVQTNGEWNVIRTTLEAQILAGSIAPAATLVTDEAGQVCFSQLTPGLYLAAAVTVVQEELTCCFDSALVALPGLGEDGLWQYSVAVAAKPEALPPIQPDETVQLKVVKLWKGDEGRTDRPQKIRVALYRDGQLQETVTLSAENNWAYTWTAKADGATWHVAEQNVPQGYTMTVATREDAFVITNTRTDHPKPPPQTGDTANVLLYILLMFVSGTMIVLLGIMGKRKRYEETK